jgi:hypothetical protein
MEPTAEQLIRDYLNRLSVAARTRLRSDDRRAFLARTRESIERRSGAPGAADPARVQEILAGLGEPATAVELEHARLAAERSRRAAASARSGLWRPRPRGSAAQEPAESRGSAPDAEAGPGSDAVPDARPARARVPRDVPRAAVDVSHLAGRELTGDIEKKVKAKRPVTSRWRPGEPLQPRQRRPSRIPRSSPDGSPSPDRDAAGPSGSGTGSPSADAKSAGAKSAGAKPAGAKPAGARSAVSTSAGPAPSTVAEPEAAGSAPGAARPEASGTGPVVPGPVVPGPVVPGTVLPGQVPPPRTAPGADPTAARPVGAAPGPGTRSTRAFTTRRWRPQRAQLADVTRSAAGRAAGFSRRHLAETAAIALMAIAGLIYPYPIWVVGFFIWLIGAAIAALAKAWTPGDKWVGLVGPPTLVIAGTAVTLALGGTRSTMGAYVHEVLANSVPLIKICAVTGAGYLAWRARRGRRDPSLPPWNRPHRI